MPSAVAENLTEAKNVEISSLFIPVILTHSKIQYFAVASRNSVEIRCIVIFFPFFIQRRRRQSWLLHLHRLDIGAHEARKHD